MDLKGRFSDEHRTYRLSVSQTDSQNQLEACLNKIKALESYVGELSNDRRESLKMKQELSNEINEYRETIEHLVSEKLEADQKERLNEFQLSSIEFELDRANRLINEKEKHIEKLKNQLAHAKSECYFLLKMVNDKSEESDSTEDIYDLTAQVQSLRHDFKVIRDKQSSMELRNSQMMLDIESIKQKSPVVANSSTELVNSYLINEISFKLLAMSLNQPRAIPTQPEYIYSASLKPSHTSLSCSKCSHDYLDSFKSELNRRIDQQLAPKYSKHSTLWNIDLANAMRSRYLI